MTETQGSTTGGISAVKGGQTTSLFSARGPQVGASVEAEVRRSSGGRLPLHPRWVLDRVCVTQGTQPEGRTLVSVIG